MPVGPRRLRFRDVARVGVAVPAVVLMDVAVRVLGFRRTQGLLGAMFPLRDPPIGVELEDDPHLLELVRSLDRVGRMYRPGELCLRRSLLLWAYLRRRGAPAMIVLGVRRPGSSGPFAHAWLEWRGRPLAEWSDPTSAYVALAYRGVQGGGA